MRTINRESARTEPMWKTFIGFACVLGLCAELHAIVRDLQGIQELNFYRLSAYVEHRGYYCHENCTVIDVETIDGKTVSSDAEDSIKECLRDFMRWIYRQLEIEFEYLTSAGAVQEMIEANEYEFTEDGERY